MYTKHRKREWPTMIHVWWAIISSITIAQPHSSSHLNSTKAKQTNKQTNKNMKLHLFSNFLHFLGTCFHPPSLCFTFFGYAKNHHIFASTDSRSCCKSIKASVPLVPHAKRSNLNFRRFQPRGFFTAFVVQRVWNKTGVSTKRHDVSNKKR